MIEKKLEFKIKLWPANHVPWVTCVQQKVLEFTSLIQILMVRAVDIGYRRK